jgi:hypothetical protein
MCPMLQLWMQSSTEILTMHYGLKEESASYLLRQNSTSSTIHFSNLTYQVGTETLITIQTLLIGVILCS